MDTRNLILNFIKKNTLAVISTVSIENKPESAVLEFGETEKLELVFDAFSNSRKYENLQQNKYVSFVIGWDENITIQYEGTAEQLTAENQQLYKKAYFLKNPEAKRWENREGIVYFKVTPSWIRYSDLNKKPWEIIELSQF